MKQVNEKYQLRADGLNFIVMENKPVQDENSSNYGKDNYVPVAYFGDIKYCLKYLVNHEVFETELKDVNTVMEAIENLKRDIDNLQI